MLLLGVFPNMENMFQVQIYVYLLTVKAVEACVVVTENFLFMCICEQENSLCVRTRMYGGCPI